VRSPWTSSKDGTLFLDRLPTAVESEPIRQHVGVAKKRVLSDEERERLLAIGLRNAPALEAAIRLNNWPRTFRR
jgi:hypothetical protein